MRAKKLSNGNQSLYLDYYNQGTRKYEFLRLYLVPERTEVDKIQNAETLRTANAYKAQKIIELQNNQLGFSNARTRGKVDFIEFMRALAMRMKKDGRSTYNSYINTINHLIRYAGESIEISRIDKDFCLGFMRYLKRTDALIPEKQTYEQTGVNIIHRCAPKPLSQNSQFGYFAIFETALNAAVREDLIQSNPTSKINPKDKFKRTTPDRCYLTFVEVQKFASTPTLTKREDMTARAFLFSCFCGLRLSDIEALTWGQITAQSDNTQQIELIQQKTKSKLYLPLSNNALKFLPERNGAPNTANVFKMPSRFTISQSLNDIAARAGIDKHITFHIARHTFATLDLSFGADLYTVSKLLGHSKVTTTQIYAKIVDESKRKAVDLIPEL